MQREYGVDLLKIVAMLLVVVNHILFWGGYGVDAHADDLKSVVLQAFDAIAICAVNIFIMASGWIMCKREVHLRRLVNLWLTVVFWSFVIAVLFWCCGYSIDTRTWIYAFVPVGCNRYWFFTVYVGLFLTMPFLNSCVNNLDSKGRTILSIGGFMLLSVYPSLFRHDLFITNNGYSLLWFVYLYLFASCARLNSWDQKVSWRIGFALICLGGICSVMLPIVCEKVADMIGLKPLVGVFSAYTSPFLFFEAIGFMIVFIKIKVKSISCRKLITLMVPSVFSVYIIHSNAVFREVVKWNDFWWRFLHEHELLVALVGTIVAGILIFLICIVMDQLRVLIFRKFHVK